MDKVKTTSRADAFVAEEAKTFAPVGRIPYYNLVIDHAKGSQVVDVDGKIYTDLIASAAAINVGHSHPKVVAAIQDQAAQLIHYTTAYFHQGPAKALADKLVAITPGDFPKKVAFGLSGSDANDAIIKFARAYTKRPYVISFDNAYHGATYGSMTLTTVSDAASQGITPMVPGIAHLPYPDTAHTDETPAQVTARCIQAVHDLFQKISADQIACILMEPIAGDAGIIVPPTDYVQQLVAICKAEGILFAVDEIQQGMGRSGKWFSIEHFGVAPDLMSLGKALGSGMPVSAVVGRADVMDSLRAPAHTFTTAGNPVCCAAALATINVIEEEDLVQRSHDMGAYVIDQFKQMQREFHAIGDVRGEGLNVGIEIVDPVTGKPDTQAALKFVYRAFEKGLILITIAGNTIRFQPALTISRAEIDGALATMRGVFHELQVGAIADDIVDDAAGW
ncbi:aspartate aminotransferase family protein [Lacticaseibacillus pabuli]|uniref:Aspartate aminotransferase family protein n=1 Tax=Lacticaseibacillus pabuli TaxID=3025672 RepID=A0ABY7WVE0_9LACO|nr:aspartate aminotransferase family protein [Lacticaseibacillus sp. KACC 23028]WDF82942.1 aspartate aminotransferase family protein [Lacticaseibacillus sp. KACC 23028]